MPDSDFSSDDDDEKKGEEDETLMGFDDRTEEKRNKLFERIRRKIGNPKPCGKELGPKLLSIDHHYIPRTTKLSLRRLTKLDLIKRQLPHPSGCVPPTALPTWFDLDLDKKIPGLPTPGGHYMYFTRGKLGDPLHRCHSLFTMYDQHNKERVVNAPYDALHDPHAVNYLSKPSVKQHLENQGLINYKSEVYCTLPSFNQYRRYLNTIFTNEVEHGLWKIDTQQRTDRSQERAIISYLNNSEGKQALRDARKSRADAVKKESRESALLKFNRKERLRDMQIAYFNEQRSKENVRRVMDGYKRDELTHQRLAKLQYERLMERKVLLRDATVRDIEADERKRDVRVAFQKAILEYKIDWLDSKLHCAHDRMEKQKRLEEDLRIEHEQRSKARQARFEKIRTMIPARIAAKKEGEKKLWMIVRKLAMRWLEKVRRRLKAPKDQQHHSVWIGRSKGVLDDTLRYLKEISGYEKMDDFVLNIIKLKRQIQRQIEIEEAEEAAAEAQAAADAAAAARAAAAEPQVQMVNTASGPSTSNIDELYDRRNTKKETKDKGTGGAPPPDPPAESAEEGGEETDLEEEGEEETSQAPETDDKE